MKVKKMEYDAATGEYKEVYEEDNPVLPEPETPSEPSLEEKVQELLKQNEMLTACVLEMSELVYV